MSTPTLSQKWSKSSVLKRDLSRLEQVQRDMSGFCEHISGTETRHWPLQLYSIRGRHGLYVKIWIRFGTVYSYMWIFGTVCNRTCEFCSTFGFIWNVGRSADRSHGQFWDSVLVHGNFFGQCILVHVTFFQHMLWCGMLTGLPTGLPGSLHSSQERSLH